jgi:hypothetical protein
MTRHSIFLRHPASSPSDDDPVGFKVGKVVQVVSIRAIHRSAFPLSHFNRHPTMALPATKRKPSGGTVPQQQKVPADDSSAKFYVRMIIGLELSPGVTELACRPTSDRPDLPCPRSKLMLPNQPSPVRRAPPRLRNRLPRNNLPLFRL